MLLYWRWVPVRDSADDRENVLFAHDQVLVAVDLHFGAGVLAHEDLVAGLHFQRNALAVIGDAAGTDGDDLRLLRLLLGGIGDDDATALLFLLLEAANEDSIGQRLHVQGRRSHGVGCSFEWDGCSCDIWAEGACPAFS